MRRLLAVAIVLVTSARTAGAEKQRRGLVLGAAIDAASPRAGDAGILREEWLGAMVNPRIAVAGWARQQETEFETRRTQLGVQGRYWATDQVHLELHVARDHRGVEAFCDFPPCGDDGDVGTLFGGVLGWDVVHLGHLVAEVGLFVDTTTIKANVDRSAYGLRVGMSWRADVVPRDRAAARGGHRSILIGAGAAFTNRRAPFPGRVVEGWLGWMVHPRLGLAGFARSYSSDDDGFGRLQYGGALRWWPPRTTLAYLELQVGHDRVDGYNPVTGSKRWREGLSLGAGPCFELARTPQIAFDLRLLIQKSWRDDEGDWNGFVGLGVTAY